MPNFRWPSLFHDISLAKEVISARPESMSEWDLIGADLSAAFSKQDGKPVSLKGRGCKDRLDLLIKKYRDDDTKALRRSGTEEEYTELQQLLEDISTYLKDFQALKAVQAEEKAAQLRKALADKRKGKAMRHAAMKGMSKRRHSKSGSAASSRSTTPTMDSDSEDDIHGIEDEENEDKEVNKKRKTDKGVVPITIRSSRRTAIDTFETCHKERMALREKEMNIREKELELQRQKLECEEEARKKRWALEEAERRQRMEIEREERKLFLDLLRKHTNTDDSKK